MFGLRAGGTGGGAAGGANRWSRRAARLPRLNAAETAALRDRARAERRAIDAFLLRSDARADRLRADLDAVQLPVGTDWRWRPPVLAAPLDPAGTVGPHSGSGLGMQATLHHDCPLRAMVLTQIVNRRATDLSPFGLRVEVMEFAGAFLSLSLPLPPEALHGLTRHHILRLETHVAIERGIEIFARLNIANGPNTDRLQHHLGWLRTAGINRHVSEFDLSTTDMDAQRLDHAWLDLILERPRMNAVTLRDMVVSRHPRADV